MSQNTTMNESLDHSEVNIKRCIHFSETFGLNNLATTFEVIEMRKEAAKKYHLYDGEARKECLNIIQWCNDELKKRMFIF